MANQPKKYKKFVASAATATLVASAIVPVASAATPSDIAGNDHEQNIKDLLELGYVSGKADGTFAPNEAVTRGQVVLMLGKWAEAQGIEVPADYLEKEYFNDYPSYLTDDNKKYYALVKAAGIFEGYEDGSLKPAQNLSRVQLAVVLNSAYEAVTGKSLVDLAGDTSDVVLGDIDAIYAPYQPAVLAMKKLGITAPANFNPTGTVTRGQFASFLNATIKAEAPAGSVASDIKSLTATGVSELTVEFNGVVDTEAAEFALTRGTTSYTVSDVDWNENNTAAVLTVDTKFVDATYTLTVTGAADKELTATIQTTREEVTSINFLSDKLVFTGKTKTGYDQAVIAFEALNQYGEDITKDVNNNRFVDERVRGIGVDKDDIKIEDGKFIVWVESDEDDDETGSVEFTYKNGDYELDAYQDVQLSDISEPGSVELLDIYNSSNKKLTTKNLEDAYEGLEEFYVLFNIKDQYGVQIDAEFADDTKSTATTTDTTILDEVQKGIRVSVSNRDIFDLADEDEIEVINVDGKYYFALKLEVKDPEDLIGGENVVEFRAKATGEVTNKTYTVEHSSEVHKVELAYPDEVIAGDETVKLPVTVTDQNGELITDAASLNKDLRSNAIETDIGGNWVVVPGSDDNSAFTFVEEDGQVYLKFKTKPNTGDNAETEEIEIDIEVDKSGEESSITLNLEPDAYPSTIVKLKDTADSYVYKGSSVELEFGDFIIEDQYGRVYDDKANITITAAPQNDNFVATVDTITVGGNSKLVLENVKDGNSTVQFTLSSVDNETKPVTNKLSVTFRYVDEDDFTSYAVYSDKVVYGLNDSDNAGIEVYGVLSNGVEVELPTSAYTVIAGDYLVSDGSDVVADLIEIDDKFNPAGIQTLETGVKVVINADGSQISHALTLTEEAPKFAKFKLEDDSSLAGSELTSLDITVGDGVLENTEIFEKLFDDANLELKDQYDNKFIVDTKTGASYDYPTGQFTVSGATKKLGLTISDINTADDKVKPSANGTNLVTLGNATNQLKSGDSFDLTISIDGVSKTIKVYVID